MASFSEDELRRSIAESRSWTEACRRLGYAGNNTRTIRKYAAAWGIETEHFDPTAARREAVGPRFTEEELLKPWLNRSLSRRLFAALVTATPVVTRAPSRSTFVSGGSRPITSTLTLPGSSPLDGQAAERFRFPRY
jgi:hypothetical protein